VRDHGDGSEERPWRLFVALPLPGVAPAAVAQVCEPYRRRFPSARWLPPGSLHVTLLFLGAVMPGRAPGVVRAMTSVAGAWSPFPVSTGPGGGRTRGEDGVAWLGLPTGGREVIGLASALAAACPGDVMSGSRAPRRTPAAHLTVARRVAPELVEALRTESLGRLRTDWQATRLVLMRSFLGPAGSRYQEIDARQIGGAPA
jgi:RNA 2',3'-cyclic 3'-phosphodiesterase